MSLLFIKEGYKITDDYPSEEQFELQSQLRRGWYLL